MTKADKSTHFGFETVAWDEKEKKVAEVFHSVAEKYDLMNDLMSLGLHRVWKAYTVKLSALQKGQTALDLAGGSGDIARQLSKQVGDEGAIFLADINSAMLQKGRDKLMDAGLYKNIHYIQANAECLPFETNSFHCLTMAFGLRNVTDKEAALRSMYRVCKPGAKLLVLEFSKPASQNLNHVYDWYSFNVLPKLGKYFANDELSYQYLAESIRMHPDQETLRDSIVKAGFEDCHYHNFNGGIVALHMAYKY